MENKQQRIENLVGQLLNEFHNEPYYKVKALLTYIERWAICNSTITTNKSDYPLSDVALFSSSDKNV